MWQYPDTAVHVDQSAVWNPSGRLFGIPCYYKVWHMQNHNACQTLPTAVTGSHCNQPSWMTDIVFNTSIMTFPPEVQSLLPEKVTEPLPIYAFLSLLLTTQATLLVQRLTMFTLSLPEWDKLTTPYCTMYIAIPITVCQLDGYCLVHKVALSFGLTHILLIYMFPSLLMERDLQGNSTERGRGSYVGWATFIVIQ